MKDPKLQFNQQWKKKSVQNITYNFCLNNCFHFFPWVQIICHKLFPLEPFCVKQKRGNRERLVKCLYHISSCIWNSAIHICKTIIQTECYGVKKIMETMHHLCKTRGKLLKIEIATRQSTRLISYSLPMALDRSKYIELLYVKLC